MIALSRRNVVAWLALGVLAHACSFDSSVGIAEVGCVEGRSEHCTCTDGSPGARFCDVAGVFGACLCDGAPLSGGTGGAAMPPVGGSAGIDVGEEPASGTAASDAPEPVVDAGGSAGFPASGGMTGSDDAGISSSTGGVGGAAGDPTGGMSDPGPKPGEAFGACRGDGSCDLPMFCMFDALSGGSERYCAPLCNGNGRGGLSCPRRRDGSLSFCVRNVCLR
jgi:hypothetical protein